MKKMLFLTMTFIFVFNLYKGYTMEVNENFDTFYTKYFQDKEFQIGRTIFPLYYMQFDPSNWDAVSYITKNINKNEWLILKLDIEPGKTRIDIIKKGDGYIIKNVGLGTGFGVEYYFKLINTKWYLYKIKNKSN